MNESWLTSVGSNVLLGGDPDAHTVLNCKKKCFILKIYESCKCQIIYTDCVAMCKG